MKFLVRSIYTCNRYEDFLSNEMERCKISKLGCRTRCSRLSKHILPHACQPPLSIR